MKKSALIFGLAAITMLPACSDQNGWMHHNDNNAYGRNNDQRGDKRWWGHGDHEEKAEMAADRFFERADMNKDGYITRKEMDSLLRKKFAEADTNHDGKLSRDEVIAMQRKEMDDLHARMRSDAHSANDNGYDMGTRSDDRAGGDVRGGTINASDNNGYGSDRR